MLIPALLLARAALVARCVAIADQAVPAYRDGRRTYCCTGHIAKQWQAAFDGACIALGGDPQDFVNS